MSTDTPIILPSGLPPDASPAPRPVGSVTVAQRNNSGSAVLLPDGRVLYMWCIGPGLGQHFQGYAPNLTDFLTLDNSVVADPPLLTGMSGYDHSSVFYAPDGELYSVQASAGGWGGNPWRSAVQVWHSPDDGVTWNLHGTVQDLVRPVCADFNNQDKVGEPFFVTSGPNAGRWVLSAPYYDTFSIGGSCGNRTFPAVWTSDDNGVTWTLRVTEGRGPFGTSTDGNSRNINRHDGALWWNMHSPATAGGYSVYRSDDDGATWVLVSASFTGFNNVGYGFAWRDAADTIYCGYNGNKIVTFPPGLPDGADLVFNQHTLERTYINIPIGGGLAQDVLFQILDDTMVLFSNGHVIGFEAQQEGEDAECLVDVEVQCCCDDPPGVEIPDCECPCIEVVLSNLNDFDVNYQVVHPITLDVCAGTILEGGPDVEVHLCGPFPDDSYLIDISCST